MIPIVVAIAEDVVTEAGLPAAGRRGERAVFSERQLVAAQRENARRQDYHLRARLAVPEHVAGRPAGGALAFDFSPAPLHRLPVEPNLGGIEQRQRFAVELALPASGHQVLVERRDGRLRPSGGEGHAGVPEGEVVPQLKIVLLLKCEDLVHRLEGGSGVISGEKPVHPHEMAVNHDLGRQLGGGRGRR